MADQIDIDGLVIQLQELIPALRNLGKSPTSGGEDINTTKIVAAIGKLNATISKQNQTKQQENRSLRKFIQQVDEATKSTRDFTDQQNEAAEDKKKQDAALAQAAKELAEAQRRASMSAAERNKEDKDRLRQEKISDLAEQARERRKNLYSVREIKTAGDLVDEYSRGVTGTAALREKFEHLGGSSTAANTGFRLAAAAIDGLAKSALAYGKSMYQGQQGAAVAAKSVNTFAQTLGTAAQALGGIIALIPGAQVLGIGLMAAGTGLKLVGDYAEAAAEMSDRLFNTYQDLSKVGASAADGMSGLGESAVRLGFGLDELGQRAFTQLITKSAQDLALFSGTVMKGRKDFVEFGEGITRGPVGQSLMNMGMRVEEINEGLASYVGLQSRVGMAQNKTQAQLQAGAAAYLKEMDGLTKLTGIQRQQMEENINRARAIEQFRAKVEAMRASGDQRQIAAADQMERFYAVLAEKAPELAQGYAESAGGLITSPAGVKFFNTIDRSTGVVQGLSSGAMNAVSAFDSTNKAAKRFATEFNTLGQAGVVASSGFGNFVEAANLGARANQDLAKSAREIEEAQNKQQQGADGLVGDQVALRREQMNTRDNLQKLVEIGIKPTTAAMKGLAEVVEGITGVPGKVVPGTAPAGGKATTGQTGAGPAVGAAAGAATGALAGAAIGSVVPLIGTGLGAVIGGVAGGIYGGLAGTPSTTVTPAAGPPASEQKILDFIGKYESGGDYNKMVGGATAPLTQMTVAEVMQFQSQRVKEGLGSAAGKYQIIQKTLNGLVQQGFARPSDRFDAATQDKLGRALLNQSGYQAYKSGQISADQFADRLAGVWAALPMASGRSRYEGVGNNRALVGRPEFMAALQAKNGGIVPARSGGTTVLAAEAGLNEAFVPLPDGRSIPVSFKNMEKTFQDMISQQMPDGRSIPVSFKNMEKTFQDMISQQIQEISTKTLSTSSPDNYKMLQNDTLFDSLKQQARAMDVQVGQLGEIISLMRTQNSTSSKILQVSQA